MNNLLPINLLIVDDHKLITEGLCKILADEASIGKVKTANNGKEALEIINTGGIDCVIMDINMPVLGGYEATRLIKKQKSYIKIIVVSMFCDAAIVSKMLKAGADAFINKDTGKAELINAINKVMSNEKYISPAIANNYFTNLSDRSVNGSPGEKHITPRELEVIHFIAEGLTNIEIAARLFLSVSTVDTHRKNILAKLHLKNTASLIKYAAEHKLL